MQRLKSVTQGHQQVSGQVRKGLIGRQVTHPIALGQDRPGDGDVSILGDSPGVVNKAMAASFLF